MQYNNTIHHRCRYPRLFLHRITTYIFVLLNIHFLMLLFSFTSSLLILNKKFKFKNRKICITKLLKENYIFFIFFTFSHKTFFTPSLYTASRYIIPCYINNTFYGNVCSSFVFNYLLLFLFYESLTTFKRDRIACRKKLFFE